MSGKFYSVAAIRRQPNLYKIGGVQGRGEEKPINSNNTMTPDVSYYYLRGTILNRTYSIHKKLYIPIFLLTIFDPTYYYGGP